MSDSSDSDLLARAAATPSRWRLEDIAFDAIRRSAIVDDALAFRIIFLASFVETGADLYASNLIEYFADDVEVSRWLRRSWQPEELQHGDALRTYAMRVWPDVDWERRYDAFMGAYSRTCTVGELEPARALELAARCMVETGTSTFYAALRNYAREPVLKDLAGRIFADEVRHYKHFYHHFRRYQQRERHRRWRIGRTLLRRLRETRNSDGYYAYLHLEGGRAVDVAAVAADYRAFTRSFAAFVRCHGPHEMSLRMGLKPLQLPAPLVTWLTLHSAPLYALWTGFGAG
ncbi:MAG TPA: ferritin-like domain-containing protein [Casimicrobiaceae bacterium]